MLQMMYEIYCACLKRGIRLLSSATLKRGARISSEKSVKNYLSALPCMQVDCKFYAQNCENFIYAYQLYVRMINVC
jgi:hypothetical protein